MKSFDPNKQNSSPLPIPSLPLPTTHLLGLAANTLYRAEGRKVRLEVVHDNGVVELRDLNTLGLLQVRNPSSGELMAPTLDWMREAYAAGLLTPVVSQAESAATRQARFAVLDRDACADRDKKSLWRFQLAWRALRDEVVRTDAGVNSWLDNTFGSEPGDTDYKRPSGSSLRRWMRALDKGEGRPGALVTQAGRPRGRSQLSDAVNAFVDEAAMWFWTRRGATIVQAQARLNDRIDEANALLGPDTEPHAKPSKEALRKRINRYRCEASVAAKDGPAAAAKLYKSSGEPMVVDSILEVVLMDATKLEQIIAFDDDWLLPACKVGITALMCGCSHVILGWHVYAGPNRTETSAEALLSCLTPSPYSAEALEHMPDLANIFGWPAALLPDNEIALVGPSSLPGLNETGITLLEPPVECPTAKAALERCFRSIKEQLKLLPGTVLDPKRAKDLGYDALADKGLTLPQLRAVVASVIAEHNVSPSKGLDGQSPLQVWTRKIDTRVTPPFQDIGHISRALGRTFDVLLTRDGIELNGIRYRGPEVSTLLNHMSHEEERRRQRKDGSATVRVKARRRDGNIDTIDVLDRATNEYVTLYSTQPEYTAQLSAWEHEQFTKHAKKRRESFKTQEDKLKSKANTLRLIDKLAPGTAFQQNRDMAALYQAVQVDSRNPRVLPAAPADAIFAPRVVGDTLRVDDGLPSSMPSSKRRDRKAAQPPARPSNYGGVPLEVTVDGVDWDGVEVGDEGGDPETGVYRTDDPAGIGEDDL